MLYEEAITYGPVAALKIRIYVFDVKKLLKKIILNKIDIFLYHKVFDIKIVKQIIRTILSFILIGVIFFTTSGFYVFEHHCNHMQSIQTSVLVEMNCCNEFGLGNMFAAHTHSQQTCDANACCKTTKTFKKLESQFELPSTQTFQHFEFSILFFIIEKAVAEVEIEKSFNFDYASNAPPIFGKQFIYYTHQLKLAPPAC